MPTALKLSCAGFYNPLHVPAVLPARAEVNECRVIGITILCTPNELNPESLIGQVKTASAAAVLGDKHE